MTYIKEILRDYNTCQKIIKIPKNTVAAGLNTAKNHDIYII